MENYTFRLSPEHVAIITSYQELVKSNTGANISSTEVIRISLDLLAERLPAKKDKKKHK